MLLPLNDKKGIYLSRAALFSLKACINAFEATEDIWPVVITPEIISTLNVSFFFLHLRNPWLCRNVGSFLLQSQIRGLFLVTVLQTSTRAEEKIFSF